VETLAVVGGFMEYLQVTLIAVLILLFLLLAVWSVSILVFTEWRDYKEAQRRHKILKG
jgi:hypothetical protein